MSWGDVARLPSRVKRDQREPCPAHGGASSNVLHEPVVDSLDREAGYVIA